MKHMTWAAVALTLAVAVSGCGDDDSSSSSNGFELFQQIPDELQQQILTGAGVSDPTVFVGTVAGTDAYIAVVDHGSTVLVYVCDGQLLVEWFSGSHDGDQIDAASTDITLTASLENDTVTGTVTIDGTAYSFSAASAEDPANLYESAARNRHGEIIRAGWVVLEDGSQRGAGKIGSTVVAVGSVDAVNETADVNGDGGTDAVTPIQPIPTGKKKGTVTKPPTTAQRCITLQIGFELGMDVLINNETLTDAERMDIGNNATAQFQEAKRLGCSWINEYFSTN